MILSSELLGAMSALAASLSWGGGDFSGGYASRQHHPFQVLSLSAAVGMLPLLVLVVIWGEGWPSTRNLLLAATAGVAGTLGLAVFYRGMMVGRTAVVAPVASVIGAMVPLLIGIAQAGFPSIQRLAGFALGLSGIWLVSQAPSDTSGKSQSGLRYALLAGLGFGGFLTLIAQVNSSAIFGPLIGSKLAGLVLSLIYLQRRSLPLPGLRASPVAAVAGLLDTAGNIFFLVGAQMTRLDVVAALSSLYPAGTVVLGRYILKERVTGRQWLGVVASILAIMLITI